MDIGIHTGPFRDKTLDEIIKFAGDNGFGALEVMAGAGSGHIDVAVFSEQEAARIKDLLQQHGIRISSLGVYAQNNADPDPDKRRRAADTLKQGIDAAVLLGVDVVCTLGGMPVPGKTKFETIEQDLAEFFPPVCDYAARHGVKIALENWFATNLQGLEHWQRLFDVVPHENFGLNFDPSHLIWQGIDYLAAVDHFADRIFHTHAKDTEIRRDRLRWLGSLEDGWWRYVSCKPASSPAA